MPSEHETIQVKRRGPGRYKGGVGFGNRERNRKT
jgi:hypothetical protein